MEELQVSDAPGFALDEKCLLVGDMEELNLVVVEDFPELAFFATRRTRPC